MKASATPIFALQFSTALGPMAIAWAGQKIVAIHLPEKSNTTLAKSLSERLKGRSIEWKSESPHFVQKLKRQIENHLNGKPQTFSLTHLALESASPFFRKVYEKAARIPAGEVRSYGELAKLAGSPLASRAVGQAMARNPFPIVVPCHRVISSGRAMGGFTAFGGLSTKAKLLELESFSLNSLHG